MRLRIKVLNKNGKRNNIYKKGQEYLMAGDFNQKHKAKL